MAQPSSSHQEDRERRRSERSSAHHHHRTISSTTLLLVLSLILAVLAVMLSIPSQFSSSNSSGDPSSQGIMGYITPKRTQALLARESAVAQREAEVARREAELLLGAPGGIIPTPSPITCPACPVLAEAPIQTIIKEVVKEDSLVPPGWWEKAGMRADDLFDRELKMAEREREISKREEAVNRREHDAARREGWIMEQLLALGNENPQTVEEEYVYEPAGSKRKAKALPYHVAETSIEIHTITETLPAETVTVPAPAATRRVAFPEPNVITSSPTTLIPRTTAVEETIEEEDIPATMMRAIPTYRPPNRWFEGW